MEPLFVVILIAIFVASFVQRLAGFGYGLIASPVALTMFSPFEVSFLMAFWGTMNSLPTVLLTRKSISWAIFRTLVPWLLFGLVLGYAGLLFLPASVFHVLAIVICLQALVSVFYPEQATRGIQWSADTRVASTLAGLLQSSISIPGPPLVVAFNRMKLVGEAFVSLFAMVFLSIGVVRIVASLGFVGIGLYSQGMAERLPDQIVFHVTAGCVVSVIAVLLAQPLVKHVSSALFKKIAAGLIALATATLIIDVLGWGPQLAALAGFRS